MAMNPRKSLEKKETPQKMEIWDPFSEMRPFGSMMSRLFENLGEGRSFPYLGMQLEGGRATWFPAVNVQATEKEYLFTADVPGLQKGNIGVEIEGGILKISGERKTEKEEKGKNYLRREQVEGRFDRSFSLPDDAATQGVKAEYKNGILTVRLPRSEEKKVKSVKVNIE